MVSLLDIIGPVMVGPSSSHTAGACRLGLIARALVGGTPETAKVELHGSFARTGTGHAERHVNAVGREEQVAVGPLESAIKVGGKRIVRLGNGSGIGHGGSVQLG